MQLFYSTLCVGLGGGLGAMLRYHLTLLSNRYLGTIFPYGTFFVNALGGLLIGFLFALTQTVSWLTPTMRSLLITGFLGGLTTFSTFSMETVTLLTGSQPFLGLMNIIVNVLGSLTAVFIGQQLGLFFFSAH